MPVVAGHLVKISDGHRKKLAKYGALLYSGR